MSYKLPPKEIVDIIDTPGPPQTALSPDCQTMILVEMGLYPSIELLARPYVSLAGDQLDLGYGCSRWMVLGSSRNKSMRLVSVADGTETPLELEERPGFTTPRWSFDSKRFAWTALTDSGIELWVGDLTGVIRRIDGVSISGLHGGVQWLHDNKTLLAFVTPEGQGERPMPTAVPSSPRMEETSGKFSQARTWQNMLTSEDDERLFEFYATNQIVEIDVDSGQITPIGDPAMRYDVDLAPGGEYLLVTTMQRPFSYRVFSMSFPMLVEIWDRKGKVVREIANLALADEMSTFGVRPGPRTVRWQPQHDAKLLWVEALDGGDPVNVVPHRDRIMSLDAPFETSEPVEVTRFKHRVQFSGGQVHSGFLPGGSAWYEAAGQLIIVEHDRDRRWNTTWSLDVAAAAAGAKGGEGDDDAGRRVIFDRSEQDVYDAPGGPVIRVKPDGDYVMRQDGDWHFFAGQGATEDGLRPFLDRRNLVTGETERIWQSGTDCLEMFIAFLADSNDKIIISHQSPTDPPNLFEVDLATGDRRALTEFPDPHPSITGMRKEIIRYERADGVPLSGTLCLPATWKDGDDPLPMVVWAYPLEYSDTGTAGQVRSTDKTFTRLAGDSILWFLTRGWAVLNDATMPIIGEPETVNDTYVEQLVANGDAAIEAVASRGIVDPERVVIAGHSYGGFMTANMVTHSDKFAAGICRAGFFNLSLTPFGYQAERRSYWEATETYLNLSAFHHAQKIDTPILLIHGGADSNNNTFPIQSERYYQALQANGKTARLVMLPFEDHGFMARESILHVIAEQIEWAERFAGPKSET